MEFSECDKEQTTIPFMAVEGSFSMALNAVPLNSGALTFLAGVFDSAESSLRRFFSILILEEPLFDNLRLLFVSCHTASDPRWGVNTRPSSGIVVRLETFEAELQFRATQRTRVPFRDLHARRGTAFRQDRDVVQSR